MSFSLLILPLTQEKQFSQVPEHTDSQLKTDAESDPRLLKTQHDALQGQLDDLLDELSEYDA